MTVPAWVSIIRAIIPKDGVNHNNKPSRLKSKVKKALDKANVPSETIRGVGRKIGDYAVTYEAKGSILYANFVKYDTLNIQISKQARKRGRKSKATPVLTGPHSSVANLSLDEYGSQIVDLYFPEEWERKDSSHHRWMAFDVHFMYHTGLTIEAAAQSILSVAQAALSHQPKIYYTVIFMDDKNILIGIGPA